MMLLTVASAAFAQDITVKGVVTDATNDEPIPFASLQLKGQMLGTNTDADGNYTMTVPADGVIIFSSIGYQTVEVAVEGKAIQNVSLSPDSEQLAETIVVAFGTTTKEAFTGSAAVLKSDELQKRATTNVTNALVGSVAGLQMHGASGAPGAGSGSINIRGIASMYASTDPLIIVDGAPYSASLSNIPQDDIESISVLKDAASAALYGARGAAGVIIVTTKKSKNSNAVVNVDMKWGASTRAIQEYDRITNPAEFYEAYYTQLYNYAQNKGKYDAAAANLYANNQLMTQLGYNVYDVPAGQLLIGTNGKLNPNATLGRRYTGADGQEYYMTPDNWTDEAYKTAFRHEYTVSVNGGNDKGSYYASVGYLNEDGIIEYSGYERFSARAKADYQIKKWLKLGTNVGFVNSKTTSNPNLSGEYGSTNLFYYTSMIAPIYPVFVRTVDANGNPIIKTDANGNPAYDYGVPATNYSGASRAFLATGNPLGSNRYNKVYSAGNQFNGSIYGDIDICRFLKANFTSTVIWGQTNSSDYENGLYGPKVGVNGEISKASSTALRQNHVQSLTYFQTIGKHDINVMLGHEYYKTESKYLSALANGMFTPDVQEINAAATKTDASSYTSNYNVEGYFLSAQYNYDYKYYVSASYRRDASSYFHPDHRWGNFWSVGAAWIISHENFMAGASNWCDMLKLKLSAGQQGNDSTAAYGYTDTYDLTKSSATTMSPSLRLMGNESLTWETTTNYNAGLEFSFFKGRLNGSIDGYYKYTKDLLFWLSVPESLGARGYYGNVGDISNAGVELVLNAVPVKTRNFQWDITLNTAHNKAKVVKLPESKKADNGGFTEDSIWYQEGGDFYNYFTYSYAGVDETGQALYYQDLSLIKEDEDGNKTAIISKPGTKKDGTTTLIGEATKYATGSTLPILFGGFGTSFRIYDFDISFTFDYQLGGKIMDSRYRSLMSPAASTQNAGQTYHKDWVNSWSADNASSDIPRWQFGDQYSAYTSDRFLTSASYLNFQSFSVGYNLPAKLFKNKFSARIYAVGENLCFWSCRKGLDPRYSFSSSSSLNVYSPVRTISGGVKFTF
ncbi:MAG: SusC/RagA family TonB-linked outer membrane protein [Bacteroidales bacterium]|nr:SusC/RagA family TonB-linked outer membrane protein [Bacteroidales bacterium]